MINCLSLNEKNLTKQPLFWLSIGIPCLGFILLGANIWMDYDFGLNKAAYDKFLDVSKLPLLFLSLSVPLVAIVAHIHRTVQTEKQINYTQTQIENTQKQIDLLEEKNRPDSYYAHVKFMTEALTSIPGFELKRTDVDMRVPLHIHISIKSPHSLYKNIFKKSKIKTGYNSEVSDSFINYIAKLYLDISNAICYAKNNQDDLGHYDSAKSLERSILSLSSALGLNTLQDRSLFTMPIFSPTENTMKSLQTTFASEDEIKGMIIGIRKIITYLYLFLDLDIDFISNSSEQSNSICNYISSNEYLFKDLFPAIKHNLI